MSLSQAKTGSIVSIVKIEDLEYRSRLAEMGFIQGKKIKIAKNSLIDPLVVIVGESRYSLNKELANSIIVE